MYIINYKNLMSGYNRGLSISSNAGCHCGFPEYDCEGYFIGCAKLIPNYDYKGKMENEQQVREYVRNYYVNTLSKLEPQNVYDDLKYDCLVTFDDGEFSHGYLVSAWLELFLEVEVPCVKDDILYVKEIKDNKPKWVMDILEDEIKKTIDNMKGFNSVRALYLFKQSEELERMADELETNISNDKSLSSEQVYNLSDRVNGYRQEAHFRRCDADMAEDAWRERRHKLTEEAKKKSKKK